MSRPKLHFRKYGERASINLPARRVISTGTRRYHGSARPGTVGNLVSEPAGGRKRDLVAGWYPVK